MLRQGEGSVEIREGAAPPSLKIRDQKTPKTRRFACSGSPGVALLEPADIVDDGGGSSFDTAVIAIDRRIPTDGGVGEALGFLFGGEEFGVVSQ
jgi:hypothetical protein